MTANHGEPSDTATAGEVIAFAPHAAAAWARAAQAARTDAPPEGTVIQFPRQCPALRAAAVDRLRFKPDSF